MGLDRHPVAAGHLEEGVSKRPHAAVSFHSKLFLLVSSDPELLLNSGQTEDMSRVSITMQ